MCLYTTVLESQRRKMFMTLYSQVTYHTLQSIIFIVIFLFYTFIIILTYKEIMHFSGKVLLAISMLIITFLTGKKSNIVIFLVKILPILF